MSEFLAEAQIVVRANTTKFIADFEKAVRQVEKQKVSVAITVNPKGFRAQIIETINASKRGLSVKVPLTVDPRGFRAQLRAAVKSAEKGVIATVGVRTGAVGPGSAAASALAGGGGGRKALTAEQAVNDAINAGAFARQRVTGLIDEQDKRLARIARQEAGIKAAQEAGKKAIQEQNDVLQARAIKVEETARAERAVTAGALEKEAARRTARDPATQAAAATSAAAAAAAAETKAAASLLAARKTTANSLDTIEKERVATLGASTKEIDAFYKEQAAAAALSASEVTKASRVEIAARDAELSAAQKTRAARAKIIRSVESHVAPIRQTVQDVQTAAVPTTGRAGRKAVNELRAQGTALAHAEAAAEKQLEIARRAGLVTQTAELEVLHATTAEMHRNTVAALENARAENTRFGAIRRATIAQIAEKTGLRGAALTAATPFIVTSAALIALHKAIGLAAQLQSELAVFQVTAGATADQMDEVSKKAEELGRDVTLPAVSAKDAAVALTELSKAGLSVEDSLAGAKGVLQLATAANIDFTAATQLTANALNSFGLAGEEATHVADVFANSANESQGSIVDVGTAMQQSSAVIRQAGISFEEGAAALTLFARNGLRGSDAGTSLRTALIRLINPSKKAEEVINRLGLRIRDAQGNVDLSVFQQFADKTRDLTAAQRDQALAIIFGQDAIRGAAILVREGASGLARETAAVNKSGTAAEVAAARTSGYAGAIENLKNQLEAVAETIGGGLLPPLTEIVNAFAAGIEFTEKFVRSLDGLRKTLASPFEFVIKRVGEPESPKNTPEALQTETDRTKALARAVFTGNIFDVGREFARSFRDAKRSVQDFKESLEDLTGLDISVTPTIDQARKKVKQLTDDIKAANLRVDPNRFPGGDPDQIDRSVRGLKDLQEQLKGGDFEAQKFADDLDPLILKLQEASTKAKFPKFEVPKTLLGPTSPEALAPFKDVAGVRSLAANLSKGNDEAKKAAASIREVLAALQKTGEPTRIQIDDSSAKEFKKIFEDFLNKELPDGFAQASEESEKAFMETFRALLVPDMTEAAAQAHNIFLTGFDPASLGDQSAGAFLNSFGSILEIGIAKRAKKGGKQFLDAAAQFNKDKKTSTTTATTEADNQATGFDRKILEAQLNNDVNAEIAVRKAAIASRQREIARIEKAAGASGGPIVGGRPKLTDAALKNVTTAKKDIEAQNTAIEGLVSGQEQDAKAASQKIKDARDKTDQAFLDALAAGRTPLERKLARAQETPGENDNIAVLKAFQKRIQAERKAVGIGVKDIDTKKKQLKVLSDELFQNGLDIAAARKTRDEAAQAALGAKGQALVDLGTTEGNTRLIIQGLNLQIASAKVVLAKAIQAKSGQLAAKAALEALKKQKHDTVNEARSALLDQAFDLAEARGNKSQMLQIIDLQIDQAKRELSQAKTLLDRLVAQTKIAQLIQKKKDTLADETNKAQDQQGITVFDLLKQNVDVFNKSAGNLIGPNQPFAGAFGFTADIAQFLTRRTNANPGSNIPTPPGGATGINPFEQPLFRGGTFAHRPFADKQQDLTSQLIDALKGLTEATLSANGNTSTSDGGTFPAKVKGNPWAGRRWFSAAGTAKAAEEA